MLKKSCHLNKEPKEKETAPRMQVSHLQKKLAQVIESLDLVMTELEDFMEDLEEEELTPIQN